MTKRRQSSNASNNSLEEEVEPNAAENCELTQQTADDWETSSSCSSFSSNESDEDEDPEVQDVDVTLDFFDPKDLDHQGLRALLQNYLDGSAWAVSNLVEIIIAQNTVGTVVKSVDCVDPIGVLTCLTTERYKDSISMRQIKDYILENCMDYKIKTELKKRWHQKNVGLIVSERLLNSPPQLAPPLLQALLDEIAWATEDEPTQELQDHFKIDTFIVLSRVYEDCHSKALLKKPCKIQKNSSTIVYARPEDEFFHKHCLYSFTFHTNRPHGKDELTPLRLVTVLTSQQIRMAWDEMCAILGNVAKDSQEI